VNSNWQEESKTLWSLTFSLLLVRHQGAPYCILQLQIQMEGIDFPPLSHVASAVASSPKYRRALLSEFELPLNSLAEYATL
jgi:hypothetical protein